MSELTKFDNWIKDGGPAALVIREHLIPVEGEDGVFFPATYAAQQGAKEDKEKFSGWIQHRHLRRQVECLPHR